MLIMGQGTDYIFGWVLDSIGGLWPLIFHRPMPRSFDHKATYYVMEPCITTAYLLYTTGLSHNMLGNDRLDRGLHSLSAFWQVAAAGGHVPTMVNYLTSCRQGKKGHKIDKLHFNSCDGCKMACTCTLYRKWDKNGCGKHHGRENKSSLQSCVKAITVICNLRSVMNGIGVVHA